MCHEGGVSTAVRFSLAGNTEANHRSGGKQKPANPVLVPYRSLDVIVTQPEACRLDSGNTYSRRAYVSLDSGRGEIPLCN